MWSAKVGRFPADRRRRLTSTQPSHSSRSGSPLSLSRFTGGMWSISAMLGFQCVCVSRAVLRRCGESQVSGSSRQDLPAVSCLIGTPPVCFCFSSAGAVISGSLAFVTSQSLTRLFFPLSVVCLSRYILFKVRMSEACVRSSETTRLL